MAMFHPFRAPDPPENPFGLAAWDGVAIVAPVGDPERSPASAEPDQQSAPGWLNGYEVRGPACDSTRIAALRGHLCDGTPEDIDHGPGTWTGFDEAVKGMPFEIVSGVECTSLSFRTNLDEYRVEAARRLRLCRWSEFAHELWTGTLAKAEVADDAESPYQYNRYLAHEDAVVLGDGAEGIVEAMSLLADAFGTCSCGGGRVVHVPQRVVPYLKDHSLVAQSGQRLYGPTGEMVLADDGYPGTSPEGEAPAAGTAWIYGTTTIYGSIEQVVRTPEKSLEDAFDAETNKFFVRAKHHAMATWLCCHFAVLVSLDG
jgi:hypothetical protein